MQPVPIDPGTEFLVACLCAEWCGSCREYRQGFLDLAAGFPGMGFIWVDVEDHADLAGDIDVENFPSILIQRGESVLFLGPMLPEHGLLKRLVETFAAQTLTESVAYANATPERREWQVHNLRAALPAA